MNLFDEPNFELLKSQIINKFSGLELLFETLRKFVIGETAFLASHFKTQILKPMEDVGELEASRKDAKPRKKGTYADGTWLKFATFKHKQ
jgi:hypothetical protein